MTDFWRQKDPSKPGFDTDVPLDTVAGPEGKPFVFEEGPTYQQWAWYPFLYESERTFRLGGLTFPDFGPLRSNIFVFGGLTLPSFSPAFGLPSSAGTEPESDAGEDTFADSFSTLFCNAPDLASLEDAARLTRASLCKDVLDGCAFTDYWAVTSFIGATGNTFTSGNDFTLADASSAVPNVSNVKPSPNCTYSVEFQWTFPSFKIAGIDGVNIGNLVITLERAGQSTIIVGCNQFGGSCIALGCGGGHAAKTSCMVRKALIVLKGLLAANCDCVLPLEEDGTPTGLTGL